MKSRYVMSVLVLASLMLGSNAQAVNYVQPEITGAEVSNYANKAPQFVPVQPESKANWGKVNKLEKKLNQKIDKTLSKESLDQEFKSLQTELSNLNKAEVIELDRRLRIYNDGITYKLDLDYRNKVGELKKNFHQYIEEKHGDNRTIYNISQEELNKDIEIYSNEKKEEISYLQNNSTKEGLLAKLVPTANAYVSNCPTVSSGWNFSADLKWGSGNYNKPVKVGFIKNNSNEIACDYLILLNSRIGGYSTVDGWDWGDYNALQLSLPSVNGKKQIAALNGDEYFILGYTKMCILGGHCTPESIKYNGIIFR